MYFSQKFGKMKTQFTKLDTVVGPVEVLSTEGPEVSSTPRTRNQLWGGGSVPGWSYQRRQLFRLDKTRTRPTFL